MASVRNYFAATLYANLATIGGQFLLVPAYLHFWGPGRYGSWLVLYSIPACFTFLDAGIGNSLGNALTIAYLRKDFRHAQRMLNAVWKFQALGLAFGFVLFAAAVLCLPLRRWLALESLGVGEFVVASLLLCCYTLLSIQLGVFTAIFRAAGRFGQFVRWNAHARWVEVAAIVLVLACGIGIVWVASAIVLVRGTLIVVYWITRRKVLPELKMTWLDAPWEEFRKLLATGIAFMVLPMGSGIVNQGSAILLNHRLGPAAVVTLSVCRQLARLYLNLITALSSALHPELTSAYASGNFERLRSLYAAGLGIIAWTAVPAVLAMMVAGPFAIEFWTKSAVHGSPVLIMACGIEAVVAVLGINVALPALASNRHVAVCISFFLCTISAFIPATLLLGGGRTSIVPESFAAMGMVFVCYAFFASSRVVQSTPVKIIQRAINLSRLMNMVLRRRTVHSRLS